jgi:cellulose synthase/poly-beta-1,6-N-acetylglucosamine synthase-like glycosyltransferase
MRRDALDSIGGFPYGSLAEDVCTSSMLLGAGWKTAYIHEPLQFGTVPDSLISHLKQRTRWVSFDSFPFSQSLKRSLPLKFDLIADFKC